MTPFAGMTIWEMILRLVSRFRAGFASPTIDRLSFLQSCNAVDQKPVDCGGVQIGK